MFHCFINFKNTSPDGNTVICDQFHISARTEKDIRDIYVCSLDSTFADESKSCAIRSAIDELEQHRWIPVTERLPEEEGDYFTTQIDENGKEISRVAYYENEWFTRFEVTAWMPLPKPYEEGAEE